MSFEKDLEIERAKTAGLLKEKEEFAAKEKGFEAYKAEKEAELKDANRDKFIAELEKAELCSPSMKPFLKEIFSNKEEYSIDKTAFTKEELVTDLLKLAKESFALNLEPKTDTGKKDTGTEAAKAVEIQKYCAENKCDFSVGYKAVMGGE